MITFVLHSIEIIKCKKTLTTCVVAVEVDEVFFVKTANYVGQFCKKCIRRHYNDDECDNVCKIIVLV